MLQLDGVAVGVADVERPPLAVGAAAPHRALDDVEVVARRECVEVGGLEDEAEVVGVAAVWRTGQQVDDGVGVHPHRREEGLAIAPPLDVDALEPEHAAVPAERGLDIGAEQDDVVEAYRTVRGELDAYGHGLDKKAEIIGLNKCDALDADAIRKKKAALARAAKRRSPGAKVMALSGVAGKGVQEVLRALVPHVLARRAAETETDRVQEAQEETIVIET